MCAVSKMACTHPPDNRVDGIQGDEQKGDDLGRGRHHDGEGDRPHPLFPAW